MLMDKWLGQETAKGEKKGKNGWFG